MSPHDFAESVRITSFTRNSCLRCGKSRESHKIRPAFEPSIRIVFGGRIYDFKNWEEARKKGFYLY